MSAIVKMEDVSKKFTIKHEKARSFQDAVVNFFQRRSGTTEEFWALRDVSFELGQGETLGIVGRNGSGKSTLLKLIARILEPTIGKVTVDGKISALIELGAGFHPELTGRENIYLNGSILGIGRKEMNRKFDQIVEFSELEQFIDTPVKHYSSGMYARLGFSVAVSVDPDVLIIDEVLSVGDESFQRKCSEKIREFRAQGVSIVFVSHSLDSVRSLCDRAIWLEKGKIREVSAATRIVDDYFVDTNVADQERMDKQDLALRPKPLAEHNRWGSREVEITGVQLLDDHGKEKRWFITDERLTLRIHYHANREMSHPVFGIAIYAADGAHVTGPNTSASGYEIDKVSGEGWIDYRVERLPLVHGDYELSAAVYDQTLTHAFDHHHRLYRLYVQRRSMGEDYGLLRIPCTWEHVPDNLSASATMVGRSTKS